MRLINREKETIVKSIKRADEKAAIYLFGSRIDDKKKGGDIDILILSDKLTTLDIAHIETKIFGQIDEQKIDFVLSKKNHNEPFIDLIIEKGVIDLCPKKN